MLANRTPSGKKSLKRVDSTNFNDQWDVRPRSNSCYKDNYSNYYSSMKLDFHRSQFDYKCPNNGSQQQQPPSSYVYSSALVCGNANMDGKNIINTNKKAELFSNNASITSLYRSTPLLNYGANSYFGWHNRISSSTLPIQTGNKPCVNEFNKFYTIEKGPSYYNNHNHNNNNNNNCNNDILNTHHSSSSSAETLSSKFGSNLLNIRKTRVKFCIVIAILIIMVAVLVAMGVAVYSQGTV